MSEMGFRNENCPNIRKECFLLDPRHFPRPSTKTYTRCLLISFFLRLGICVEVDVDRITILPPAPSLLPPTSLCFAFVPTHNSFFNKVTLT